MEAAAFRIPLGEDHVRQDVLQPWAKMTVNRELKGAHSLISGVSKLERIFTKTTLGTTTQRKIFTWLSYAFFVKTLKNATCLKYILVH